MANVDMNQVDFQGAQFSGLVELFASIVAALAAKGADKDVALGATA